MSLAAMLVAVQSLTPAAFVGEWEGSMQWAKVGEPEATVVAMTFALLPANKAGTFRYELGYNGNQRKYLLLPQDEKKGQWKVDEQNGIVLDTYLAHGALVSVFQVDSFTIATTFVREKDVLKVQMTTFDHTPVLAERKPNLPAIGTFRVRSIQYATLSRKK